MVFKKFPEDFYVEEMIDEKFISPQGKYSLYKIRKVNITTFEAIQKISNYFGISENLVSFAGLKDKKSVSIQYFCLPAFIKENMKIKNLEATFINHYEKPLSPSCIKKNLFKVVLRDVQKKKETEERLREIAKFGVPNYFDHQRFGYAIRYGKFIFEEIMKGEYEEALKVYFMSLEEMKRKRLKKFKKMIKRHFGEWKRILKYAEGEEEKRILKYLLKTGDTKGAISLIPEYKLKLYGEGYQSFLWNRSLYYFLKSLGLKGYRAKHKVNPFFFYREIPYTMQTRLLKKNFPFPLIGEKIGDHEFIELMRKIEKERKITIKEEFKKYLVKGRRSAIFIPQQLKFKFLNGNLIMSFFLSPGSYATVLLKSLISYEKILKGE